MFQIQIYSESRLTLTPGPLVILTHVQSLNLRAYTITSSLATAEWLFIAIFHHPEAKLLLFMKKRVGTHDRERAIDTPYSVRRPQPIKSFAASFSNKS